MFVGHNDKGAETKNLMNPGVKKLEQWNSLSDISWAFFCDALLA